MTSIDIAALYLSLKPKVNPLGQWQQITEIEPGIFLGGVPNPQSDVPGQDPIVRTTFGTPMILANQYEIKALLSITIDPVLWDIPYNIRYLHYTFQDDPAYEIPFSILDHASQFIYQATLQRQSVWVHCQAGVSRSATLLAAFYLKYGLPDNLTPTVEETIRFLQSRRPGAMPNIGFLGRLVEYHDRLRWPLSNSY